mmetsp:Transcript_2623/g.7928  ORF Transcript_2623/g.7928 Transcript_2623/m.7928 type:complete len:340 (-) Transcript_2623:674-1693(-)
MGHHRRPGLPQATYHPYCRGFEPGCHHSGAGYHHRQPRACGGADGRAPSPGGLCPRGPEAHLQRHHRGRHLRGPAGQDLRPGAVLAAPRHVHLRHDRNAPVQPDHLRARRLARGLLPLRLPGAHRGVPCGPLPGGATARRERGGAGSLRFWGRPRRALRPPPLLHHPHLRRHDHAGHLRHDPLERHGQHDALLPAHRAVGQSGRHPDGRAGGDRGLRQPAGRPSCRRPGPPLRPPWSAAERPDHGLRGPPRHLPHLYGRAPRARLLRGVLFPDCGLWVPGLLGPVWHELSHPVGDSAGQCPQQGHGLGVRPGELHRECVGPARRGAAGYEVLRLHLRRG